jgi:endonuclease III related protein
LPLAELEQLVRSSGYYRQKASRLKGFVAFLDERYGGSLKKLFCIPPERLRSELLSLKGIGQETADAILLYAGKHEIFVVDAYARRILARHALVDPVAKYDEIRDLVERALRRERPVKSGIGGQELNAILVHDPSPMSQLQGTALAQVYNEMHGLLVQVGKHHCYKTDPDCQNCLLRSLLPK